MKENLTLQGFKTSWLIFVVSAIKKTRKHNDQSDDSNTRLLVLHKGTIINQQLKVTLLCLSAPADALRFSIRSISLQTNADFSHLLNQPVCWI